MENDLLGYLLRLDDPAMQQRIEEHLRSHPQAARQLTLLTKALAPLEVDRERPEPPTELVPRTLGFVAAHIANSPNGQFAPEPSVGELLVRMPPDRLRTLIEVMDRASAPPARWRRADAAVIAAVLLLACGIVLAAVPFLRHRQNQVACQNRMREFHQAFQNYGDTHEGRFPQVNDTPPNNTASSFLTILRDAGVLSATEPPGCPVSNPPVEYAYSLGWRDPNGHLFGLRREPDQAMTDLLPILADRPPPARDGAPSLEHGNGQNVLFVGGNVRFCTDYLAGVNRDNIYRNDANRVGAGLHLYDTVLGFGYDQP